MSGLAGGDMNAVKQWTKQLNPVRSSHTQSNAVGQPWSTPVKRTDRRGLTRYSSLLLMGTPATTTGASASPRDLASSLNVSWASPQAGGWRRLMVEGGGWWLRAAVDG